MNKYSTPKNVFLHLLMMSMLYLVVINLMVLINQYIDVMFPDTLDYYYNNYDSIRMSSSILLICTPAFLISNWVIEKEAKKIKEVKESSIRKWLVYLTLFVAAITIIIYLIQLVFKFYGGELTVPFLLKMASVMVITTLVFTYYFMDLYNKIEHQKPWFYGTIAAILLSIVAGFFIVGSPAQQRMVRFDNERVSDLSNIQWQVIDYWQNKNQLPESLDDLESDISGYRSPVDPKTNEPYEYRAAGDLSFELCATFETDGSEDNRNTRYPEKVFSIKGESNWDHQAERTCFKRTIDPDFYQR